ncbi:MAG: glycine cleavage system protein GcvH [Acidobacteriota bacterium]
MYPENFYYTKDHEWIRVDGEKGVIGITNYAQKELGDIVYIELPKIGRTLKFHETIGTIESVKAVSDIYSPVSGEIIEINENLKDSPELINNDPHGEGWILVVKIKDKTELKNLMSSLEYEKYLEGIVKK